MACGAALLPHVFVGPIARGDMLRQLRVKLGAFVRRWWARIPPPLLRLIKLGVGFFFFLLGVIGIFIPVMPQVAFFLLSLTILSSESPWARGWLRRAKRWVARRRRQLRRNRGHG